MSNKEEFDLIETVAGNLVKVPLDFRKGTFIIEFNNVLLNIHMYSKVIFFHVKDDDGIYRCLGDLSFKSTESNKLTANIFSTAIENIFIGNSKTPVSNLLSEVSDLAIDFSIEQKNKWKNKRIPKSI